MVLAVVSAAIDAGELSPNDPETIVQILLGALIEAAMLIVVAEIAARRASAGISALPIGSLARWRRAYPATESAAGTTSANFTVSAN